ncbi:MAG: response regulator [Candidatus Nanopelagicales bacterium]
MVETILPLNAIIIDDDSLVASLLQATLTSNGFNVVTAASAAAAREALTQFEADVAIIDLDLGSGPSGIDVAHLLDTAYPQVARLVLTDYPDLAMAGHKQSSLPPNTIMFPKKSIANADQLLTAIADAAVGNLPAAPSAVLLPGPLANLSASQIAILRMLAQGLTVAEIAERRDRSQSAIEKAITAIYKRLELTDDKTLNPRTMAIRTYIENLGIPGQVGGPSNQSGSSHNLMDE